MAEYRRNRVPGGTFFFTANLADRTSDLLVAKIDALRAAVRAERRRRPFHIDAWVVLPDHLHCIWTLPEGDMDYSERWRQIKKGFSKALPEIGETRPEVVARFGRGIWQNRFWEHTIRDEKDYAAHMDYVHFNPVKHRLVEQPRDWAFSTFHRCVRKGIYPATWGMADIVAELEAAGERRA